MAYEVFTFGYGSMLKEVLNAIAAITNSNNYASILATATAIYLAFSLGRTAFGRDADLLTIFKNIIIASAIISALTQIKITVTVTDKVNPSESGVVDNVPWAVAFPLWVSSKAEYILTNTFETALSVPSEVSYTQTGLAGAPKNLLDASLYITTTDTTLRASIVQFYKDCVFAALLDKLMDPDQVAKDKAVEVIKTAGSVEPSRTTVVYSKDSSGKVKETTMTCDDAANEIVNRINNDKNDSFNNLAQAMGYSPSTLENLLQGEFKYYMGIAENAKDTVYQEALLTVSKDALIAKAAEAGVDPNQLGLTIASAKEKMFLSNVSAGEQVREFLPKLRGVIILLAALGTPIILAIGLARGEPIKFIATAFAIYFFPVLWGTLNAFVNFYINHQLASLKGLVATTSYKTPIINIANYPLVMLQLKDHLAVAGWLASMIPIISIVLLSGSAYAFVKVAGGITSSIVGASSGAAASTATGNINLGNVSTGNSSLNNFNANKWDSTSTFSTGYQIGNTEGFFSRRFNEDVDKTIVDRENVLKAGTAVSYNGVNLTPTVHRSMGVNEQKQAGTSYGLQNAAGLKEDTANKEFSRETFGVGNSGNTGIAGRLSNSFSLGVGNQLGVETATTAGNETGFNRNLESQQRYSTSESGDRSRSRQNTSETLVGAGGDITSKFPNPNLSRGAGALGAGAGGKAGLSSRLGPLVSLISPQMNANTFLGGKDQYSEGQTFRHQDQISQDYASRAGISERAMSSQTASIREGANRTRNYAFGLGGDRTASFVHRGSYDKATGREVAGTSGYNWQEQARIDKNAAETTSTSNNLSVSANAPIGLFTPEGQAQMGALIEKLRQLDPEAARQAEQIPTLNRAVVEGDRNRANQLLPQSLQVPDSPQDYNAIKQGVAATHDDYAKRVNPNQFNSQVAEEAQKTVRQAEGTAYHYFNEAKDRGKTAADTLEGKMNEAQKAIAETNQNLERNGTGLTKQYDNFSKQITDQIGNIAEMGSSPEWSKAFEALKRNSAFEEVLAAAGISKGLELAQWASNNKEAIRDFVRTLGDKARTVARLAARNPEILAVVAAGALGMALSERAREQGATTSDQILSQAKQQGAVPTTVGAGSYREYAKAAEEARKELQLFVSKNKVYADPQSLQEVLKNAEKVK